MSWAQTLRQIKAAERREMRQAQKRQKELEKKLKELEKSSELERARSEVEAYENQLEILLSVHKEQGPVIDWCALAVLLPHPCPELRAIHELSALQTTLLALKASEKATNYSIELGRRRDQLEYQEAMQAHRCQLTDHSELTQLAKRIVAGDTKAYTEAVQQMGPFAEISLLRSSIHFTFHDPETMECHVTVAGQQVIPSEVKSLTSSGKCSVRSMPKARFHEVYQDYVCGCVLRIIRESFALLPVKFVIVTASVESSTSNAGDAVLSVACSRSEVECLNFEHLDASDTVERFTHKGDFKATRKIGAFQPITPLTLSDLMQPKGVQRDSRQLIEDVQQLRAEFKRMAASWKQDPEVIEMNS